MLFYQSIETELKAGDRIHFLGTSKCVAFGRKSDYLTDQNGESKFYIPFMFPKNESVVLDIVSLVVAPTRLQTDRIRKVKDGFVATLR